MRAGLCYRERGVPDDERKGRRLGDETKGRIADLASGWTVDGKTPPAPALPIQREPSGPTRVPRDAPRRETKTAPPPPPGSSARRAFEDKDVELPEPGDPRSKQSTPLPSPSAPLSGRPPGPPSSPPSSLFGRSAGPPPLQARSKTGQVPLTGKPRPFRPDDPPDLSTVPEADKTKENRGAVGIKHNHGGAPDNGGSLTTNEVSGTIGGDTPSPIFDRAAIAAGQSGAIAAERIGDRSSGGTPGGSGPTRTNRGGTFGTGTGPTTPARGTPRLGAVADKPPHPSTPRPRSAPPSQVIVDDSLDEELPEIEPSSADPPFAVPVGEFDHGETLLEQDKPRAAYSQATIKRGAETERSPGHRAKPEAADQRSEGSAERDGRGDRMKDGLLAAGALLGVAGPGPAAVRLPSAELRLDDTAVQLRGGALFNDASGSSTGRFERGDPTRGDPTIGDERGDATALSIPGTGHVAAGTLRTAAALPRKRGIAGDLRYVATVVFGVREANRELAVLQAKQATRQQSRRHHLVTLGRTAVTLPEWIDPDRSRGGTGSADGRDRAEHPALRPAREQLSSVEDERAQHAGHVAAADAELTRVRRDREAKAKQYEADLAALDAELLAITRKLEPLDKEAAGLKKRAADLRDSLRRIDGKIASNEASLTSVKAGKLDLAAVQAELATLKADRKAIRRDEPVLAGQLDALSPRIAALEAARGEAQRKREELAAAEQEDQRRVEELLTAIGAKRKVVDRATAEAEARRDKILFQLGERLYVDRPEHLTGQLAPIDEIDVEFGIADRRMMELREIVSSIDKRKVARGVALIVLLLGAIGALIFLVISLRS